ncbi:endolytic transglycosylase MltG [Tissierella carlieri]|uniref:Endolytic transglycosylase MltG n=1 Tax=Tissierella carlieri TaxID=689904 RepID=A0ABT1S620_9FIRM|nr:endolytic transglycosylase MltG [Tissierella carlieri]MBU5314110.1 endolytic transglycosylase MltG [Tissierella carlieri]MCQ4921909.1 endolytic transglycosylase MltG [Tissierella carlieri]
MDKKIKITYLFLGVGIGIIIASTLYSFYPKIEYIDLTDDIIMERARSLGMVGLKESIDVINKEELADEENTMESANDEMKEVQKDIEEIKAEVEEREIVVESGSSLTRVSKQLYNANLIDNIDEFISFVKDKKLDKKIVTGSYKIELNSSYDEIIEILTKRPN